MFAGVRGAYARFFAADGFFVAAGLAFFFLVTMIPLVMLGLLLFALTALTWAFYWFQVFVLLPANVPGAWLAALTLGFSLLLSMLMFYLGYRFVPVRHMRPGPALAGAIVAT